MTDKKKEVFWTFVKTIDDFHPNYTDDEVRVFVTLNFDPLKPSLRIGVWGNDDFGMQKDFYFETYADSETAYREYCREVDAWRVVTKEQLKKDGFTVF